MTFTDHALTLAPGIPATLVTPDGDGPHPAVLLLHGTASHRDEVGAMYARTATALAGRGVASLRIDFPGCGASTRPQTDFTVTNELADARAAFAWLGGLDAIDPARIGVLGFSQGGMIAALLSGREPRIAALATWSSGIVDSPRAGFDFLAPAFADGRAQALVDMGFKQFVFSRTWWQEIGEMDLADAVADFSRPLLAVAGSADDMVPPSASLALASAVKSPDITVVQVPGADHIFNALDPAGDLSETVVQSTADWFAARLAEGAR